MGITELLMTQPKGKLNWGETNSLWEIGRYKIIGLTIMEIFLAQAKDIDLKNSLHAGVELLIVPHLEKIQKFMNAEGLEVPAVPPRKNLDIIGKQIEPNSYITDGQIANDVREIFKYGLELDMRAVTNAIREDVRDLSWDILTDDHKGYTAMVKLHSKKNWLVPPPTV